MACGGIGVCVMERYVEIPGYKRRGTQAVTPLDSRILFLAFLDFFYTASLTMVQPWTIWRLEHGVRNIPARSCVGMAVARDKLVHCTQQKAHGG